MPSAVQGVIPVDWLAVVKAQAEARGGGQSMMTVDRELLRILSLPMMHPAVHRCPDRQGYARTLLNHAAPAGFMLRDLQIDAAYTYETKGGLLGPIGVGWGKTLITLLCAMIAIRKRGHERVMINVPSEVFSQLTETDLPEARKRLALDGIPFWIVDGDFRNRKRIAEQPGFGVWIYSYSSISTKAGHEELMAINPTCFICDEAHFLASPKSARTRRWTSVVKNAHEMFLAKKMSATLKARGVECVAISGTITKKSIEDYAHMAEWALGDNSPVPIAYTALSLFTSVIDATVKGTALMDIDYARMAQLVEWARIHGFDVYGDAQKRGITLTVQDATREAFRYRLNSAPGVVATSDAGVDCSLIISWSEPPRPVTDESEKMVELMRAVVEDMKTPDGDVIDYGMHTFKWLWELSTGFYNSLVWPTEEQLQALWVGRGKPITQMEAGALIQAALTHHELLQAYHKELRYFLDGRHQPGCDTPMLVAKEIVEQIGGREPKVKLPPKLIQAYQTQKAAYFDDLPTRKPIPIRICPYKIDAAVEWCREYQKSGGLIWYHHPAVGEWLSEKLTEQGLPHTLAKAGDDKAAYKPGLVVASYAHATGKNLQKQSRNLILEMRREADKMEQCLGRTHRTGQAADDVRVDVLVSNGFDLALFNAVIRDADYSQSTTGMRQRLCYATYSPVIPPTRPSLAVRLGIVSPHEVARAPTVAAQNTITPIEALSFKDVFRSAMYARDPTPLSRT